MSAIKTRLARLEARLQALVEGGTARLFPASQKQKDLMTLILDALSEGTRTGPGGELEGPSLFIVRLHPDQARVLEDNPTLLNNLIYSLREAGTEARINFSVPPVIRVVVDEGLAAKDLRVEARFSQEDLPQTTDVEVDTVGIGEEIPSNAFLIVDGTKIVSLNQGVINLGRRPDNQLVIDDPRISRLHAQLRAVRGSYIIFDLESTGGTFVNGERIHQQTLRPGDVISLSGMPLVYGQDALSETQDLTSPE